MTKTSTPLVLGFDTSVGTGTLTLAANVTYEIRFAFKFTCSSSANFIVNFSQTPVGNNRPYFKSVRAGSSLLTTANGQLGIILTSVSGGDVSLTGIMTIKAGGAGNTIKLYAYKNASPTVLLLNSVLLASVVS